MLIDLHSHSYPKSDDSFMSVDELIEGAKALGLDGICLTDHDAFWSQREVDELSQRHGFLVIPGSEINTDMGHVLAFGLEQYEFGMHKPEYLRECVDRVDGVIIAAHPYRRRFLEEPARRPEARAEMLRKAHDDDFFGRCHGIESLNGRGTEEQNRFSADLGRLLGTGLTAGSDAHRVPQLGTAATEFHSKVKCLDDLVSQLQAGSFHPVALHNGAAWRKPLESRTST